MCERVKQNFGLFSEPFPFIFFLHAASWEVTTVKGPGLFHPRSNAGKEWATSPNVFGSPHRAAAAGLVLGVWSSHGREGHYVAEEGRGQ